MLALPKTFGNGQLTASAATLYTAPTGTSQSAIVKEIWLCNTTASDYTYTLYSVPSGGTTDATKQLANAVNLPAGYTHVLQIAHVLDTGELLRGMASSAAKITYRISGVELL